MSLLLSNVNWLGLLFFLVMTVVACGVWLYLVYGVYIEERVRFSERIKAGQARSSKASGRPALADDVVAELRRLRGEGLSFKKIQVATGVPVATMHKYLAA